MKLSTERKQAIKQHVDALLQPFEPNLVDFTLEVIRGRAKKTR